MRGRPVLAARFVPAGIYGTIISASVMATASVTDSVPKVVVAVLVTVLVYWLAERYAELLAARMRGETLTGRHVRHVLAAGWPMVEASYTPVLVMVVAGLFGAGTPLAVLVALLYTTALLFVLGWLAATRTGMAGWGRWVATLFAGALGIVIIILKLALH